MTRKLPEADFCTKCLTFSIRTQIEGAAHSADDLGMHLPYNLKGWMDGHILAMQTYRKL